jgi:hypothetical protein
MFSATTKPESVTRTPDVSSERTAKITRVELIDRIVAEAKDGGVRCNRRRAGGVIDVLDRAVTHFRKYHSDYYFSAAELAAFHDVLDIVTPDSVNGIVCDIRPGSAYAGLNELLLRGDEVTIEHSRDINEAVVYCKATVQVWIA